MASLKYRKPANHHVLGLLYYEKYFNLSNKIFSSDREYKGLDEFMTK